MPVPKDDKNNHQHYFNASPTMLPYEMLMTSMPQYSAPQSVQPIPMPQQLQQAQQQKQQDQSQQKEKELNKIRRKALIGAVLLFIPIINLIGIGLLFDALIHYLKLRSR